MAVVLAQGAKVTLGKDGEELHRVRMGLGWDPVKHAGLRPGLQALTGVDLDAACLLFDADHHLVDAVWARQLKSKDGSVTHTGDDVTGHGPGDDEAIIVDLASLPSRVTALVFTASSFSGADFSKIASAYCRLLDDHTQAELARYEVTPSGTHNAKVFAKVVRDADGWTMTAIGAPAVAHTINDLVPAIAPHL
ncbi:TerD family protein [Yinghuangia seranimata]|uniref:TerD family protein n=1 Tax=Yinghuangia seranimata TaxID=408067 RepID=UPI00248C5DF5|nr:TerD family protein [Yinghuangia seranimata]MDI2125300.1 TerD family protein [Yinghuangia seranimata]